MIKNSFFDPMVPPHKEFSWKGKPVFYQEVSMSDRCLYSGLFRLPRNMVFAFLSMWPRCDICIIIVMHTSHWWKKKQPSCSLAAYGLFTTIAILLHLQCDFPLIDVNKGINNKCCECYSTLNTLLDSDECFST